MNIIEYVKSEQRTLREFSFNDVDSLVLSTFCYFNFEANPGFFPAWGSTCTIGEVAKRRDPSKLYVCTFKAPESEGTGLMDALAASNRFKDVRITHFSEESHHALNKQFCAMTFLLPDGSAYLAFRGTDESIAGWREDFEMSFKDITSSEALAYDYACRVARSQERLLRLGGHSKGGTMAEFAALLVDEDVFQRVIAVYNHEGPGFIHEPSKRITTYEYGWKLHKTVVEQSMLGMLFETRKCSMIVSAQGAGFIQHSPFYWNISGSSFVYCDRFNAVTDFFNSFFNEWVLSKSLDDRSAITKALFDPLTIRGVVTLSDAMTLLQRKPLAILYAFVKADPEARACARHAFAQLPSAAQDEIRRRLGRQRANVKARVRDVV